MIRRQPGATTLVKPELYTTPEEHEALAHEELPQQAGEIRLDAGWKRSHRIHEDIEAVRAAWQRWEHELLTASAEGALPAGWRRTSWGGCCSRARPQRTGRPVTMVNSVPMSAPDASLLMSWITAVPPSRRTRYISFRDRLGEVLEGGLARKAELRLLNGFMTRCTLRILRRRAYSPAQFKRLVAESAFRACHIKTEGIGLEARMKKQVAAYKEESTLQDTR